MVLFFIDLATRKVEIAGIAPIVNGLWMSQVARKLTGADDGLHAGKRYLIHDREPLFTTEFLHTLECAGVKSGLDRMIFFGEAPLRTAVQDFVEHYHSERDNQGLENRILRSEEGHLGATGAIQRHQRLGGMLNYYNRDAA